MSKSKRIPTQAKPEKRILAVRVKRIYDEDGVSCHDYLGEYARTPSSEFSIDRAHTEDCPINTGLASELLPEEDRAECDCGEHGSYQRGEFRYFNPSFNYVDKHGIVLPDNTAEEVRKYVREDYNRMEDLNAGRWYYLGIRAEADVTYPAYGGFPPSAPSIVSHKETVTSAGFWGIESDSEESYFAEVQREDLDGLKDELLKLGFSKRAIATAFKSIEEVSE